MIFQVKEGQINVINLIRRKENKSNTQRKFLGCNGARSQYVNAHIDTYAHTYSRTENVL